MSDLKDVVKTMAEHPIATIFIVSEITSGIAKIIRAARGDRHISVDELKQIIGEKPDVATE